MNLLVTHFPRREFVMLSRNMINKTGTNRHTPAIKSAKPNSTGFAAMDYLLCDAETSS